MKESLNYKIENVQSEDSEKEFNPSEQLKEIAHLSHEERRDALVLWKEKYNEQREALADMQIEMMNLTKSDKNIGKEELFTLLEQYSLKYKFTSEQKEIAQESIELFSDEHEAVHALREQYPDDKELFLKIFGDKPFGKIKIEEDPISLFVSCAKTIDFSKIYNINEGTLARIKFALERYFSIYGTPVGGFECQFRK
jgi:hypothetical protein